MDVNSLNTNCQRKRKHGVFLPKMLYVTPDEIETIIALMPSGAELGRRIYVSRSHISNIRKTGLRGRPTAKHLEAVCRDQGLTQIADKIAARLRATEFE